MKRTEMNQAIKEHGENLKKIFSINDEADAVKLSKAVFRLEQKAHKLAEDYCNGDNDVTSDNWEERTEIILVKLRHIFLKFGRLSPWHNVPVFINGDCRGYALKIDDKYVREKNLKIHKDWGGYGIIAPDFRQGA